MILAIYKGSNALWKYIYRQQCFLEIYKGSSALKKYIKAAMLLTYRNIKRQQSFFQEYIKAELELDCSGTWWLNLELIQVTHHDVG